MPRLSAKDLLHEALALDAAGKEKLAIPLYRRAITAKLPRPDLHTALIGLGSSLHTVGQPQSAIRTLRKARTLFPHDPAILLFLALAHAAAGQHKLALRQLADAYLKESTHSSLPLYRKTLLRKYHAVR
ncbi:MAG TPA: tetratricopeptide repeat protein [Phycisphaerae bacterium]|nr:tetratricopeptide repeat protein [Phycisphaerae bacterium]